MSIADSLIDRYSPISNQVDTADLRVIIGELEKTLEKQIPGAIVEFGCYIGTTSLFVRRLLDVRQETREFHVYDSFEGLPPKRPEDVSPAGTQFQAGSLSISKKQFNREFYQAHLTPPIVHKGWFEALVASDVPTPIAFAFLDGDFYTSIKASLGLVLPRMAEGGLILIHDYAREALPGVAKAVRERGLQPQVRHGLGIVTV